MTISLAELAALPTAPTMSAALTEAARYVDEGPFRALRRAMFGSTTFEDFIAAITLEHSLAEGIAILLVAGLIDPDIHAVGLPDSTWTAGEAGTAVGNAHGVLDMWAQSHTTDQLAHLFEAAADRAARIEQGGDA